jgi:hypothetical protein
MSVMPLRIGEWVVNLHLTDPSAPAARGAAGLAKWKSGGKYFGRPSE